MAPSLENLGWFYKGKAEQAVGKAESLDHKIVYLLLVLFTVTGFFTILTRLYQYARLITSLFVLPGKSLKSFGEPSKSWALVTGASDGIGKEFAIQLARAGYSTLLVSRTESKLDALASDIKSKYKTPTKTLAMDFNANNDTDYAKLKALVDSLDIAILINNVGVSHSIPVPFLQTPQEEIDSIITINCTATLRVTQVVAAGMVQRKRGLILTMGSFGGLLPTPLLATYSGSKAFLQQWSTALGAELSPHSVSVELVLSHLVTSAMSKIRKPSALVPTPQIFVKAVLGKIGRTGGAQGWMYTSTPYWSHAVLQWIIASFLGTGNRLLLAYNLWFHKDIRRRALAKRERINGKKSN